MLCGFAIENLCKALLAVRLSEQETARVRAGGDLPNALRTDKLHQLCARVDAPTQEEDDELLARLETAVVWFGRYPVPTRHADLRPTTPKGKRLWAHAYSSTDVDAALALVQRVALHVRGSLPTPTAA